MPAPEPGTSPTGVAYRLVTIDGLAVESGGATIDLPDADLLGSDGRGGLVVRPRRRRLRRRRRWRRPIDHRGTRRNRGRHRLRPQVLRHRHLRRDARRSAIRSPFDNGRRVRPRESLSSFEPTRSRTRHLRVARRRGPAGETPVATTGSAGDTPAVDGWFLADTARGRLTFVDAFDAGQPVIWSADSNFAAVLADSTLLVFDRAAGELVPLSAPRIRAIGSAASPWPEVPED